MQCPYKESLQGYWLEEITPPASPDANPVQLVPRFHRAEIKGENK